MPFVFLHPKYRGRKPIRRRYQSRLPLHQTDNLHQQTEKDPGIRWFSLTNRSSIQNPKVSHNGFPLPGTHKPTAHRRYSARGHPTKVTRISSRPKPCIPPRPGYTTMTPKARPPAEPLCWTKLAPTARLRSGTDSPLKVVLRSRQGRPRRTRYPTRNDQTTTLSYRRINLPSNLGTRGQRLPRPDAQGGGLLPEYRRF